MRTVMLAVALMLAVVATARAQNFGGSPAEWFRISLDPPRGGAVPTLEGYVQNDSPFTVTNVGIQIDGFDDERRRVGKTATWTLGDIAPGKRGYFIAPTIPRATTYQITIWSFDVVSR